ncbi:MAG: tetratricopeptide repeat protein [Geminicoccaceae bacterium]
MLRRFAGTLASAFLLASLLVSPVHAQSSDTSRLAAMQSRIFQLEEEIRRLTGRVEQLEYENRSLGSRMDQLVADMDNRLQGLATTAQQQPVAVGDAVPMPQQQAETAATPVVEPLASPDAATSAANAVPSNPPAVANGAEKILGTIPRNALLDLPQPSEEALAAAAASLPAGTLSGGESERFDAAMALLRAGSIDASEVAFRRFVEDFPESGNAPVASFWIGETFLARGDNANAAATFARNVRTYGFEARKAPDNLLKLGVALNALGDPQKACASFDELEKRFTDLSVPIRQVLGRERATAGCS